MPPPLPLRALLLALSAVLFGAPAQAEVLPLPALRGDALVGELSYITARSDDTLSDLARENDLGFDQIVAANPGISPWMPRAGARVLLPSQYILPPVPREGIVLNVAELRLYYYQPRRGEVLTFPVSIGRMDWRTPLGRTRVLSKERNPVWSPPLSIRQEHLAEGEFLPDYIPGGAEDNPLGKFALRLAIPGYFIHGTDQSKSFGIGMRVTHGCIRMYPEDIEELFSVVPVGAPVFIVNLPVKVGVRAGALYLEVHRPVDAEELEEWQMPSLDEVLIMIRKQSPLEFLIDLAKVEAVYEAGRGVPTEVSF